MKRRRLDTVFAHRGNDWYSIGWFGGDEEAEGDLHLGELEGIEDVEDAECSNVVRDMADVIVDGGELCWYEEAACVKALRVARMKLRELQSKKAPLEEWEKQALAAGWKPPRGRM